MAADMRVIRVRTRINILVFNVHSYILCYNISSSLSLLTSDILAVQLVMLTDIAADVCKVTVPMPTEDYVKIDKLF